MSIILSRYSRLKFITIRLEAVSPSEAVLWIWFFTDQHHTSRVDDIGGILNKIAAAALYLIIDLVFMMDMEADHLIPGVTVHAVNKKSQRGASRHIPKP